MDRSRGSTRLHPAHQPHTRAPASLREHQRRQASIQQSGSSRAERTLETESECGADDVEISGDADAIVLSQVIEVLGEMFIEHFAPAHCKTISHPPIDRPVIKHFVGDKQRQRELVGTDWMFDLKTVAI